MASKRSEPHPLLAHEVPDLAPLQEWLIDQAAAVGLKVLVEHEPQVPIITWRRLQTAPRLGRVLGDLAEVKRTLQTTIEELPDDETIRADGQPFSLKRVFVHTRARRQTAVEGWVLPRPDNTRLVAQENALRDPLGMPLRSEDAGRYWVRLATFEPGGRAALTEVLAIVNEDSTGSGYELGPLVAGSLFDG